MRGFADLHIHSSNSDGVYPPRELAAMAKAAGITVLALTDHDTLKGLPEMKEGVITDIDANGLITYLRQHTIYRLCNKRFVVICRYANSYHTLLSVSFLSLSH